MVCLPRRCRFALISHKPPIGMSSPLPLNGFRPTKASRRPARHPTRPPPRRSSWFHTRTESPKQKTVAVVSFDTTRSEGGNGKRRH